MKVHGVYLDDGDGFLLQEPVYMHLKDAIEHAEKLVKEEQMQMVSFRDNDNIFFGDSQYHDWKKVEDYVWKGGWRNLNEVKVKTIEVIK